MKFIEKLSLTIFSTIILILSLILSLMLFNWVEIKNVYYALQYILLTFILSFHIEAFATFFQKTFFTLWISCCAYCSS